MPSSSITSSSNSYSLWLFCLFLCCSATHTRANEALLVPKQLSLSAINGTQQLSISWVGGTATAFDMLILRTELNETVFYKTISVPLISGRHQWTWTSAEPLECTSLSIKVRARDGQRASEWSNTQIHQGYDIPSNPKFQMLPQDKVVPVGASTTFCCIVGERELLRSMKLGSEVLKTTRLSRRTYSTVVVKRRPSNHSGNNIYCQDDRLNVTGSVIFAGYPPLSTDFVCETRNLTSAVCHWNGVDTYLYGRRATNYSINERKCLQNTQKEKQKNCTLDGWAGSWTLVAVNPLGQHNLTDSAELSHRVRPVKPDDLSAVVHAWNATILWVWEHSSYSSFPLVCEVAVTSRGYTTNRTFSGVGLQSVVLSDMHPNEEYTLQIRCGAQKNFWKWGDWSEEFSFKTRTTVPDAPEVWVWMNRDNTGQVVWKPLTQRQSHGRLKGYQVTFQSSEENLQHTVNFSPDTSTAPFNLSHMATLGSGKIQASVIAENEDGGSAPSAVLIPLRWTENEPIAVSRAVFLDGGFSLSWEREDNSTCDYVVEWYDASCRKDCPLDWIKVAAPNNFSSIESANFLPGVRYNISLYCCSSEPAQLLLRWQGYMQELVPSRPVYLSAEQRESDIVLSWEGIPLANRRGFLLGYNVYVSNDSHLTLIANLPDIETRKYEVKGYSKGSYKFTVKAYTSAGEDTGATASVMLEPQTDWLILEILTSLGITALFLVFVTFICYKKRKWVKRALYPDIPEPKLPGDWSRTQGPMDVKPSPHSMVHIVEKMLVVIPEEDEDEEMQRMEDEPADTDEPTSLRYYNQVVDERPIRPRFPDSSASSASSMDSARTDVTYTGVQTSGSSLAWSPNPLDSSEFSPSQAGQALSSEIRGGGGYRPQVQPRAPTEELFLTSPESSFEPQAVSSGGYKPQRSWHFDSPTEAGPSGGLAPSLGSPTSVASTQFLLPEGDECAEEKHQLSSSAASWFTNLLSTTKP
ncbi:LIF receptor subunit alpha a [Takifugu rubripes]|uniref:LIF receptor subunit alpha a n=1 Tax=Takifugu rubripes TaxID=31033 RepID=H2V0U3_TAKRU|nr:leukemia inhibitory factor receptor-like [Takifugu rubripes]